MDRLQGPDTSWKRSKVVKKPIMDPIKAKLAAGLAKLPNKVYDEDNSTDTWSSGDSDESGSDDA